MQKHYNNTRLVQFERHFEVAKRRIGGSHDVHVFTQFTERLFATATSTTCTFYNVYNLFTEYATSAGHYKNMYTHRNEKKRHKTLWKKALVLGDRDTVSRSCGVAAASGDFNSFF